MAYRILGILLATFLLGGPAVADDARKSVLVLPFELVDTSLQGDLEGASKVDMKRLKTVTAYVEQLFTETGRFRIKDRGPVEGLLEEFDQTYAYTFRCKPCALEAARKADADLVVSGWVQKVSNLIRNLTIRVQDGQTGKVLAGGWTSLRGNTEKMLERSAYRVFEKHVRSNSVLTSR
ncbi:DUF3280 domain-containing protein [Thiohalorhabdus methylotrophus]|uniref:DUF3280 domain-containing protein n=1 Tax=Thiohalorhabdus methylotrophus TaxID=3242694 RepID=A0ABV4TWY3_9GAMM